MAAVPNLFEFIIRGAPQEDDSTPESIAQAIATSDPFIKAISIGLENGGHGDGIFPSKMILAAL